jgi:hypothetical protein
MAPKKKPTGWASVDGVRYETVLDPCMTQRFPGNPIVKALLDAATQGQVLDLNEIHRRACYSTKDLHELYRLIGYSVDGFADVFPDAKVGSSIWPKKKGTQFGYKARV